MQALNTLGSFIYADRLGLANVLAQTRGFVLLAQTHGNGAHEAGIGERATDLLAPSRESCGTP